MKFEWDENKAKENLKKHGISFNEAREAFFDPNEIDDFDSAHSGEEKRFWLIGLSSRRLLFIVFTEREKGDTIRLISARKAKKEEEKTYGKKR